MQGDEKKNQVKMSSNVFGTVFNNEFNNTFFTTTRSSTSSSKTKKFKMPSKFNNKIKTKRKNDNDAFSTPSPSPSSIGSYSPPSSSSSSSRGFSYSIFFFIGGAILLLALACFMWKKCNKRKKGPASLVQSSTVYGAPALQPPPYASYPGTQLGFQQYSGNQQQPMNGYQTQQLPYPPSNQYPYNQNQNPNFAGSNVGSNISVVPPNNFYSESFNPSVNTSNRCTIPMN
jgi:hypothetical protein